MPEKKPGFDEQFCPSCGDIVNEKAPYCPGCGHPINPNNQGSKETTETGDIDIGYETIEEKRKRRAEKAKEVGETVVQNSSSVPPIVKSAALWVVGLFVLLAGLGSFGSPETSPIVGIPIVLIGFLLLPPIHGLIGRDADPLSFGSQRIVEERSVVNPDQPCVACASPVDEGVERERVKQFLVFGGAISSNIEGQSIYCQSCARGEVTHVRDDSLISKDEAHNESNQSNENIDKNSKDEKMIADTVSEDTDSDTE